MIIDADVKAHSALWFSRLGNDSGMARDSCSEVNFGLGSDGT